MVTCKVMERGVALPGAGLGPGRAGLEQGHEVGSKQASEKLTNIPGVGERSRAPECEACGPPGALAQGISPLPTLRSC